jgi:hypothetical protein
MKTQNALTKLHRAGFRVTEKSNAPGRFVAINTSPYLIEFLSQRGEITLIRVRRGSDQDDVMRDYSAGMFVDNITQAIAIAR